jgi:amidohydrolase
MLGLPTTSLLVLFLQAAVPKPQVVVDYEHLHRQPELGHEELETAKFLRARLEAQGFKVFVQEPSLETAVITVLDTGRPGPTVCLRAEMDARPQAEETGLAYASTIPNRMHSCGHDAHAAILLNAASRLSAHHEDLVGKIVFLFQPAEETAGGADDIVRDRTLQQLGVSSIFALHSAPGLPVGSLQLTRGPALAGSNYFSVVVSGRESHAATPQAGDDVLVAAATMVHEIANLPERTTDVVNDPLVVSITCFSSGDSASRNIIPGQAVFEGTIRSFHSLSTPTPDAPAFGDVLKQRIAALATAMHVAASFNLRQASPATVNDESLFDWLFPALGRASRARLEAGNRYLFSEDFAYYTEVMPALYFSLGIAKDSLGNEPVHTSRFTVHPDALSVGVDFWNSLVHVTNSPGAQSQH